MLSLETKTKVRSSGSPQQRTPVEKRGPDGTHPSETGTTPRLYAASPPLESDNPVPQSALLPIYKHAHNTYRLRTSRHYPLFRKPPPLPARIPTAPPPPICAIPPPSLSSSFGASRHSPSSPVACRSSMTV